MVQFSNRSKAELLHVTTTITKFGISVAVETSLAQNLNSNVCLISWKYKKLLDNEEIEFTVIFPFFQFNLF